MVQGDDGTEGATSSSSSSDGLRGALLRGTVISFGPRGAEARKSDVPKISKTTLSISPETWCWHCCHPCGAAPLPMPVSHDYRSDVFTVRGAFCSWGCMRGYSRDSVSRHASSVQSMILSMFRKRFEPHERMRSTMPAPPRQLLRVFGGTMSIEQFRACSELRVTYDVLPPKMLPLAQIIEEQRANVKSRALPRACSPRTSASACGAPNP